MTTLIEPFRVHMTCLRGIFVESSVMKVFAIKFLGLAIGTKEAAAHH
jgi:hypothetical protein